MSDVLEIWNQAPKPGELTKAMNEGKTSELIVPKSAIVDPINASYYGGTRAKPTSVPYAVLRRMAQIPAIAAVINTRLNQVASHAKRPRFNGDKGFRIALKDRDKKMSKAQKERAKEIEEFFLMTGWERNAVRKDNFNQFLRKITRDSLTLDVMTFEKVGKLKGHLKGKMDLAELWAIDAATVELVVNNPIGEGATHELPVYKPVTRSGIANIGEIAYVQKVNGVIAAEYTEDDMAFAVRNPRTDLDYVDFGMSELEVLIEIVTGIVNGVRYNTSYFSHSNLPQGVLSIIGKYEDEHLEGFKRHWKTLTQGAAGKWSVPVMTTQDGAGFQWTPFKNSNKDMEFNQFLEFLFNISCAVYQIDPNEVGFKSWTAGNSMTRSDNTKEKMEGSKDKGFVPLMNFISDTFNSEVVDLIDDEFVFEWVGVDDEDEDNKLNRQKLEIDMGKKTIAEIRKEDDMEEILGNDGKPAAWTLAPANPQLLQVYMQEMQMAQAEGDKEDQQKQSEVERQYALEDGEVGHARQLEIMDKQHQQTLEQKTMEQKMAPKKEQLKKSIEDNFRQAGFEIDWQDY